MFEIGSRVINITIIKSAKTVFVPGNIFEVIDYSPAKKMYTLRDKYDEIVPNVPSDSLLLYTQDYYAIGKFSRTKKRIF
uniref:hypothetical protein n=1 Tax=Candidatus Enterococcus willemsii TaxID=1857215 RepID=UPI00403FBFD5